VKACEKCLQSETLACPPFPLHRHCNQPACAPRTSRDGIHHHFNSALTLSGLGFAGAFK
jgi:hypothetical protein